MIAKTSSLEAMIKALLLICLSLCLSQANGKPMKSSHNKTGGYNPIMHNIRTITVGRNGLHDFNAWNNRLNNYSKVNDKKEMNSESDFGSEYSDSGEWSLKFDPNYFASLNAANHRPIDSSDSLIASPTDGKPDISSSSTSHSSSPSVSSENMFYYSPETYGKTSHKNHKTGSFSYSYPSTSTTSSTTTTTPPPKLSNNRFGDLSTGSTSNEYSQPLSQPYNYDESTEEEEPNYYEPNEEIARKVYYPNRSPNTRHKEYSLPDYYGSDLSSMSTSNDKSKVKTAISPQISPYGGHEELNHNIESYESGGNVRFPSKYHTGGTGAYYPSYYPSPYYPQSSEHGHSGDSFLGKSSGWLGPGIAGLLLGILPFGLLMASMVPAFMSVPIVSTVASGRRKRHISDVGVFGFNDTKIFLNPGVLNIITRYGMSSLEDPECLKEMFCTFGAEGKHSKNKNLSQNIVYNVIDWTPDPWAKSLGMDTLFNAIKHNKCEKTYQCLTRKVK